MFKTSAFSVDTGRQTTPPLVDGVVARRICSRLKRCKNYKKNWLRLAIVIVKNKLSRFYGLLCIFFLT